MSEEIGKREKKTREHISKKKKKSFSRKKILNMIFFIIIVIFVAVLGNRIARHFWENRAYNILMKAHSKVEEDIKITNFYEKKNWEVDTTRETWRNGNNFLIKDTKASGAITYNYYIDENYYILTEAVDDINNITTKYASIIKDIQMTPPNLGLQTTLNDDNKADYYKKVSKFTTIKSVTIEGIDCYQIYMRELNDIYFMRKSDNRVIREVKYVKNSNGNIDTHDSGVIEVTTDTVTDSDIVLPDLSTYVVQESNYQDLIQQQYNQSQEQVISAEENSNQ